MGLTRSGAIVRLGPYELGERLGNGGMAEVYLGRRAGPHGFSKRFAIKRILPQLALDTRFIEMFCEEARICSGLSHRNIVQVHDFGEDAGELFMVMEYVDGVSVARLLRVVAARGDRFPIGTALYITAEVLRGLEFAHEARDERGRLLNIVHRDVSPGNILVGRAGDVKLTDFGIVLTAFVDRRTYPGELKGKMGYMSPEQVIGEELDARSDLFTVGIVLAEMLLARPLFPPGESELDMLTRMYEADLSVLDRHADCVPKSLQLVLRVALARDREKRYQNARSFGDAIRSVADELGIILNDTQLSPWLLGLGILPHASGTQEVVSPALTPKPQPRVPPATVIAARPHAQTPRRRLTPQHAQVPSDEYHIQGSDGMIGPLGLPQVLELIGTGQVRGTTLVSVDGARPVPLAQVPTLAIVADRPAYAFVEPSPERVLWRHVIDRSLLPTRLFEIARREANGLLILRSRNHQKRVYFERGVPYFVVSSDRRELLGVSLVKSGLLDAADVNRALVLAGERGQRLGEMLVSTGKLRPTALLRALIDQLEARFAEVGRWMLGEMLFVDGEQSVEDRINPRASGYAMAAQALHEGYSDAEIAALLGPIDAGPIKRLGADVDVVELALTPPQRRALELAPGASSLRAHITALARDAGTRPEETLRGVFVGLCAGVLGMPGWNAARPSVH